MTVSRGPRRWDKIVVVGVSIVAVAFSLSAMALSSVLPPSSQCHMAPGASKSVDGLTYCSATVPWPSPGVLVNSTEWGFEFEMRFFIAPSFDLEVSVKEPWDGSFYGAIATCGAPSCHVNAYYVCNYPPQWQGSPTSCSAPENASSPAWFAHDDQAGISFSNLSAPGMFTNISLMVGDWLVGG